MSIISNSIEPSTFTTHGNSSQEKGLSPKEIMTKLVKFIGSDDTFSNKTDDENFATYEKELAQNLYHTADADNSLPLPLFSSFLILGNEILITSSKECDSDNHKIEITISSKDGQAQGTFNAKAFQSYLEQLYEKYYKLSSHELSNTSKIEPQPNISFLYGPKSNQSDDPINKIKTNVNTLTAYNNESITFKTNDSVSNVNNIKQADQASHPVINNTKENPTFATSSNKESLVNRLLSVVSSFYNYVIRKIKITPPQEKPSEVLNKMINVIQESYKVDKAQKENLEEGIYRVSGPINVLKKTYTQFQKGIFNDKADLHSICNTVKQIASDLSPFDTESTNKIFTSPEKLPSVFMERIDAMDSDKKTLYLIILKHFCHAYNSADDSKSSKFNKETLILGGFTFGIFPQLLSPDMLKSMESFPLEESKKITAEVLTSISINEDPSDRSGYKLTWKNQRSA